MIAAAREAGRELAVICQRRLYAPVLRVRQAIDAGKLGQPVLGTATLLGWRSEEYYRSDPWRGSWDGEGGGVLVHQAPHQIDILQWYMGEVEELYGAWANLNHPYIKVEDTSLAIIRFKSGALGNIVLNSLLIVTGLLALGGILAAEPLVRLIAPGFAATPGKLELTVKLTRILFPTSCPWSHSRPC